MKILVIDDDKTSLAVSRLAVERCGHEAVALTDSAGALDLIKKDGIRAVVSDWIMPGLSGLDLVRALRADPGIPYVYFLVLTGTKLGAMNFMEAMDAGADDYMEKPVDKEMLRVRLRVAARMLHQDREISELRNIIPICAHCRRVRRDDQAYESMEAYVSRNTRVTFSHGICPDCLKKFYPNYKP